VRPCFIISVHSLNVSHYDKFTIFKTATECFDSFCEDMIKHPELPTSNRLVPAGYFE
jgi:hypothetical protein